MQTASDTLVTSAEALDALIVALDFPSANQALAFVDRLEGHFGQGEPRPWLKVGMELFYSAGADLVRGLHERGFRIFLDLKLHDIPNTVAGAVRSVTGIGASLLTVHAAGGLAMMEAAAEAAKAPGAPRLLAVTVLTSMDRTSLATVGIDDSLTAQALRLVGLARRAGITGLVCSAEEVAALRAEMGPEALLVIPGIRPPGAGREDQKRVATAAEAIARGASLLVVGRAITRAADPLAALAGIQAEMAQALEDRT